MLTLSFEPENGLLKQYLWNFVKSCGRILLLTTILKPEWSLRKIGVQARLGRTIDTQVCSRTAISILIYNFCNLVSARGTARWSMASRIGSKRGKYNCPYLYLTALLPLLQFP